MTRQQINEQLQQLYKARSAILVGGQSYSIGSRSLTRADLGKVNELIQDYEAALSSEAGSGLMDRTCVAVFEGR